MIPNFFPKENMEGDELQYQTQTDLQLSLHLNCTQYQFKTLDGSSLLVVKKCMAEHTYNLLTM